MNSSSGSNKNLKRLSVLVLAILISAVLYQIWYRHYHIAQKLPAREPCNLHEKKCKVRMPEGRTVSLDISPKPISGNKPTTFSVTFDNIPVQQVSIFFTSLDDVKGLTKIQLEKKSQNLYQGQFALKSPQNPEEGWLAIVHLHTADENIAVPYRFSAQGSNSNSGNKE